MRAYSQTTGVWLRGMLQRDYGIAPDSIEWIATEDAHVPGFADPAFVRRAPAGAKLTELFAGGEIDAVIGDSSTSFGETRSVIPEPEKAAVEWFRRTGVVPVNHVMALRSELVMQYPWLPGEILRMFGGATAEPRAIDLGLEFAFEQGLTQTLFGFRDLF